MAPAHISHISPHAKQCRAGFQRLAAALTAAQHVEHIQASVGESSERFAVWAGNLGAFNEPIDHKSADYRLREATSLSQLIVQNLEELLDVLQTAGDIADGTRPDASLTDEPDALVEDYDQEDAPDTEATELGELCAEASDIITNLLKVSVLIRQSTDRDRYAKAAASGDPPFLRDVDIRRIGDRFPKIRDRRPLGQTDEDEHQWLRERLGNANAQRRQFLRYAKNHHNRLASATSNAQAPRLLSASNQHIIAPVLKPQSHAPSSRPTLAPTDSSTVNISKLPQDVSNPVLEQQDDPDDALSFVSAQDLSHEDAEIKHRVIALEDVSNGRLQFECPYCRGIIQPGTRSKWKKHVFSDLRAYVCTFRDCSAGLFEDRRAWFHHELEAHRCRWICQLCSRIFARPSTFREHLRTTHSSRLPSEGMLDSMIAAASRPVAALKPTDCPLCDDWSVRPRHSASNEGVDASGVIHVSPDDFRKHLGDHLEQLALFAIPPALDAQSISGSQKDQDRLGQNAALVTQWRHGAVDQDDETDDETADDRMSMKLDRSSNHDIPSPESRSKASRAPATMRFSRWFVWCSYAAPCKIFVVAGFLDLLKMIRRRRLLRKFMLMLVAGGRLIDSLTRIRAVRLIQTSWRASHQVVFQRPYWFEDHDYLADFTAPLTATNFIKHWYPDWLNGRPRLLCVHGDGDQGTISLTIFLAHMAIAAFSRDSHGVMLCFHYAKNDAQKFRSAILLQLLREHPDRMTEVDVLHHLGVDFLDHERCLALTEVLIKAFEHIYLVIYYPLELDSPFISGENKDFIQMFTRAPNVHTLLVKPAGPASREENEVFPGLEEKSVLDAVKVEIDPTIVSAACSGTQRVKVYELKNDGWYDRGTGLCTADILSTLEAPHDQLDARILVNSEVDSSRTLLETRLIADLVHQRQQETLIVWTEANGVDMALSFQEAEGCGLIWAFVSHIQTYLELKAMTSDTNDTGSIDIGSDADPAQETIFALKDAEHNVKLNHLRSQMHDLGAPEFRSTSPLASIARLQSMSLSMSDREGSDPDRELEREYLRHQEYDDAPTEQINDYDDEFQPGMEQVQQDRERDSADLEADPDRERRDRERRQRRERGRQQRVQKRLVRSGPLTRSLYNALAGETPITCPETKFEAQEKSISQLAKGTKSAKDDGDIL